MDKEEIIYSINVADILEVCSQIMERPLTEKELTSVKESVGDYIDWFQAIENAIGAHVN